MDKYANSVMKRQRANNGTEFQLPYNSRMAEGIIATRKCLTIENINMHGDSMWHFDVKSATVSYHRVPRSIHNYKWLGKFKRFRPLCSRIRQIVVND